MIRPKEKAAPSVKTEAASKTTFSKCDPNPSHCAAQATCGKQAAMAAYSWQVLSLDSCTRLFRQHPEWTAA